MHETIYFLKTTSSALTKCFLSMSKLKKNTPYSVATQKSPLAVSKSLWIVPILKSSTANNFKFSFTSLTATS